MKQRNDTRYSKVLMYIYFGVIVVKIKLYIDTVDWMLLDGSGWSVYVHSSNLQGFLRDSISATQ